MKYRIFGKTGEQVSALGFGCMRLPLKGKNPGMIDRPQATKILRHAIDHGLNYVDTAWPYHSESFSQPGESEPFLGEALQDGYRDKVKLATKLPCWLVEKKEDFASYLEQQLERLKTSHIDFYLLHSLNKHTWPKMKDLGALEFLNNALDAGKIKYAGFSFHDDLDTFKEITDAYDWSFTQIMYNYYDEHFQAGREGMHYAAAKGLGVVVMEPLRGGALVRGIPEKARRAFEEVDATRSNAEWALRWLWKQGEVDIVLSGMSDMAQVEENLELAESASEAAWTEREEQAVLKVKDVIRELQRVPCTDCGYCLPCPEGVAIPRIFSFINDHYMLGDPNAKMRYNNFLGEKQKATACVRCGQCEEQCPQQINIMDELAHVAEVFKV